MSDNTGDTGVRPTMQRSVHTSRAVLPDNPPVPIKLVMVHFRDAISGDPNWVGKCDFEPGVPMEVWAVGFVINETWNHMEIIQCIGGYNQPSEQYLHSLTIPRETIIKVTELGHGDFR